MICNVDASGLEWVVGTYLSQDKVAMEEIWSGKDQHSDNQEKFKLPSRLIAKKFVFRLIYGGTEYSYSVDSDFMDVSSNQKYWKKVIDAFYDKYDGWARLHIKLMQEATTTGQIVMPTGRVYSFTQDHRGEWPRTTILNYPIQGLGADVMAIIRAAFWRRWHLQKIEGKIVSSVHDSIVCDVPEYEVGRVVQLYKDVFRDGPMLFERWFGHKFNLPLNCEISVGPNMCDLKEI